MIALLLLLLAQAPDATGGAAQPATTAAVRPKHDPDEVICQVQPGTGSRISAKTCRTRAEWDRLERDSARFMHNAPQSACSGAKPGSPC